VIFNHLLELSNGELNLTAMKEELSTSQNLMKVNKKQSNKTQFFTKNETATNNRNQNRPSANQNRPQQNNNRNQNASNAKPNSPDNTKANLNNPNYKGGKNFKPKNNPNI
jgi:hypothetical protein